MGAGVRRSVFVFLLMNITCINLGWAAGAEWVRLGKPVKAYPSTFTYVDASRHALNPSLVFTAPAPILGWIEVNIHGVPQVYIGQWTRSGWALNRETQNEDISHRAFDLTTGSDGKIPYLAWVELNGKNIPQLHVKRRSDGQWIDDGPTLNMDPSQIAANPVLSAGGAIPFLAWCEYSPQRIFHLYVKHRSVDGWRLVGKGSLNVSSARDAIKPALAPHGSNLYLTWAELSDQNFYQVYVKQWDGSKWNRLGGSLNMDSKHHALNPSIAVLGDTPYVSWIETDEKGVFQLFVKRWDEGRWIADGKNLNIDPGGHAMSPSLIHGGTTVYLAWTEFDANGISRIHVKHRYGDRWESDDQRLDGTPAAASSAPSLASFGTGVYLAWKEVYPNGLAQIVVKRLALP